MGKRPKTKLFFAVGAKQKMDIYCNEAYDPSKTWKDLKEISGMGFVYPTTGGDFIVTDVVLLPQTSGFAHTNFDSEKVLDLMEDMHAQGRGDELDAMWLWWHSHVRMAPNPSSIDTDTIARWHEEAGVKRLITVVNNIYGEYTARYDQWEPRLKVHLKGEIWVPENEALTEELRADIEKNVEWSPANWYSKSWDDRDLAKKGSAASMSSQDTDDEEIERFYHHGGAF